jgi:hypothetical protein
MRILADTVLGVVAVDLDDGTAELLDQAVLERSPPSVALPLLIDADSHGSRIAAVVDRRPPLVLSDDAGATWREAGGGLPAGRAVAISPDHPDRIVFASSERLYLSEDGGRFWRSLPAELIEIVAVAWES